MIEAIKMAGIIIAIGFLFGLGQEAVRTIFKHENIVTLKGYKVTYIETGDKLDD